MPNYSYAQPTVFSTFCQRVQFVTNRVRKVESAAPAPYSQSVFMDEDKGTSTALLQQAENALQQVNKILEAVVQVQLTELQAANGALHARIAEHEATRSVLHRSETRYCLLAEMLTDGLLISEDNRLVYANPAFLRLAEANTAEQVVGKSLCDFFHPASYQQVQTGVERLLQQGGVLSLTELLLVRLDGGTLAVEITAAFAPEQPNAGLQILLRDVTARKEIEEQHAALLTQLAGHHQQQQILNHKLAATQEDERKALARELHDQVGQSLTILALNLQFLREQVARGLSSKRQLIRSLDSAHALVVQSTRAVRAVTSQLRPPTLDDLGLFASLQWYATTLTHQTQLQIKVFGEEPTPRLAEPTALALFRIAQEALINVVKHAHATQVDVHLWAEAAWIFLTVDDNGCGFDAPPLPPLGQGNQWGILGMHERAVALGGELVIESYPEHGTIVQVTIPRFGV